MEQHRLKITISLLSIPAPAVTCWIVSGLLVQDDAEVLGRKSHVITDTPEAWSAINAIIDGGAEQHRQAIVLVFGKRRQQHIHFVQKVGTGRHGRTRSNVFSHFLVIPKKYKEKAPVHALADSQHMNGEEGLAEA